MGQISQFLRKTTGGVAHWCPACLEIHHFDVERPNIFTGAKWQWDGNIVAPTFFPSMNVIERDPEKEFPDVICHYFLRAGVIEYLSDCTHGFRGVKMSLPPLPEFLRDKCL